jgi:hypothetical protein
MRVVILTAAIFLALAAHASATAIVAVWSPTYVVIGADGREVTNDGRTHDICKISAVGDVTVAESGLLELKDDKNNITKVDTLIREELSKGGSISDRITRVEKMMFNIIKSIDDARKLPDAPPLDPQLFGSELFFVYNKDGEMVADYSFTGFDSRISGIGAQTRHCPSAECTPGTVIPMGHRLEIAQVMNSDPTLARLGPIDAVREIIQRVATQIPDVVGPPISIVKITPEGGPQWIDKGKCGDSD